MNELQVIVQQEPGKIAWNFEDLKAALTAQLEVYKGMVYDDDSIADAKADVASLRKLKKAVEDKRKEIKTRCLEPYTVLEAQAKELTGIIDEPIAYISGRVTQYEEEQRAKRRAAIVKYMESALSGIDPVVASAVKTLRYDTRWENKTTPVKDWKADIDRIADETRTDISVILAMDEEFQKPCMDIYVKTLALGKAVEKQNELRQQKEAILEAQRQREEALRRNREAEERRKAAEEQERLNRMAVQALADALPDNMVLTDRNGNPVGKSHPTPQPVEPPVRYTEPEQNGRAIRIFANDQQYKKILSYIRFLGATYQED